MTLAERMKGEPSVALEVLRTRIEMLRTMSDESFFADLRHTKAYGFLDEMIELLAESAEVAEGEVMAEFRKLDGRVKQLEAAAKQPEPRPAEATP